MDAGWGGLLFSFNTMKSCSQSECINIRAEEGRRYNSAVLWHDKAEAAWRTLTNEGDTTALEE